MCWKIERKKGKGHVYKSHKEVDKVNTSRTTFISNNPQKFKNWLKFN